ncbi:hypothetical protein JJD41_05110 [Oxynema sp. CENA135]|uniref:slr1601 family putative cell division protein n=1 Tax=Oxynema sp. CENA135 TaxID=984206 RepID=UPI00190BDA93|nr:hypothetical protein [Oxynema sp. CENA135]MBK4729265.1 hypothetical protein [Oxynema sp. CENA135]
MNAIQPPRPPLVPIEGRQSKRRPRRQPSRRHPHRAIAVEVTTKLAVQLLVSVVAVSTLVKLVPYQETQQEKLDEIRAEVKTTNRRVDRLQADFSRYFSPEQTANLMEEQSYKVDPTEIQIIWKQPETESVAESASDLATP